MKELTYRQQEVLDYLITYQDQNGFPPTNAEVAEMMGCKSANAAVLQLRALEKKGAIELIPYTARGIRIVGYKREIPVNLNSIVKVKLSDAAVDELRRQHDELKTAYPQAIGQFEPPRTDENGYASMTLWSLMSDLGHMCNMTAEIPFEIKLVVED